MTTTISRKFPTELNDGDRIDLDGDIFTVLDVDFQGFGTDTKAHITVSDAEGGEVSTLIVEMDDALAVIARD